MGEHEKCPKCKNRLAFHEGGYAGARAIEGDAAPIAGYYSCWSCGYHKDVDADPVVELTADMVYAVAPKVNKLKLKQDGDVLGLVRETLKSDWRYVQDLRRDLYPWPQIIERLQKRHPEVELKKQVVVNAYHRINQSKQAAVFHKGARQP